MSLPSFIETPAQEFAHYLILVHNTRRILSAYPNVKRVLARVDSNWKLPLWPAESWTTYGVAAETKARVAEICSIQPVTIDEPVDDRLSL